MNWQNPLAALALAFGSPASHAASDPPQSEPVELTEAQIIALELERYRRLTVPVTIQGKGPFRFMIDTGAQATVLSHDLAEVIDWEDRRQATLIGMASIKSVETVGIPEFSLGARSFYIQSAPLVEGEHIGDADGILGLDSLQGQRVLLDFTRSEIAVADAEQLGGNRGFEIVVRARRRLGQLIIADAELDGIRTAVVLDTGAQGSVGNLALLRRLRGARSLGETELTDINGILGRGEVRVVGRLRFGRAQVQGLPIIFFDSPSFTALGLNNRPALMLGMAELRLFDRVAIDFDSRSVLFDLPREAWSSTLARRR